MQYVLCLVLAMATLSVYGEGGDVAAATDRTPVQSARPDDYKEGDQSESDDDIIIMDDEEDEHDHHQSDQDTEQNLDQ